MHVYGKLLALTVYYIVRHCFYFRVDESGSECIRVMKYVVGSKSFRPDIQKLRQMENAVRDI